MSPLTKCNRCCLCSKWWLEPAEAGLPRVAPVASWSCSGVPMQGCSLTSRMSCPDHIRSAPERSTLSWQVQRQEHPQKVSGKQPESQAKSGQTRGMDSLMWTVSFSCKIPSQCMELVICNEEGVHTPAGEVGVESWSIVVGAEKHKDKWNVLIKGKHPKN